MTTSNSRLMYQRGSRWWADFRRYDGGDREPLVPEGKGLATRDRAEAEALYAHGWRSWKRSATACPRTSLRAWAA
jgi:hypothetical protein